MADDVTPGEIARRLEDVVREVRGMSDKMLLREVYDAQRAALDARVTSIEQDRAKLRNMIYGFAGTFLVSTIVQVLVVVLTRR